MGPNVAPQQLDGHPVSLDIGRPRMAKANAQHQDIAWNVLIGRALQRAVAIVGWTNKEAAAKANVDAAEFGKWISGERRPQFDRLFAVEELREPLCVTLAQMSGANVMVTVKFKRSAA